MRASHACTALAILAAAAVLPVHGQRAIEPGVLHSKLAAQDSAGRSGYMVGAGALAAIGGFFTGGYIGYNLERRYWPCTCDDPGLGGMILGSAAGAALAIPAAVHLANQRRGSWASAAGVSLLMAASVSSVCASLHRHPAPYSLCSARRQPK